MTISAYRKAVAALVGAGLIIAQQVTGIAFAEFGIEDELVTAILAAGTAIGVWAAPNTPAT